MTRIAIVSLPLGLAAPCAAANVPLDATLIATLEVNAGSAVRGQAMECEDVCLAALLQALRAMPFEPLRGAYPVRVSK